jgi:hypothetical protein
VDRTPGSPTSPTTHTTLDAKKNPMTMKTFRSTDMNLLYEALSRARMRQPHDEASYRTEGSARRVAMRARAQQSQELGDASQRFGR